MLFAVNGRKPMTIAQQMKQEKQMSEINILEGYATRKQMAKSIGVTERTIARWTDLRNGLPVTKIGNRVLYRVESAREWIAAREVSRNPSPNYVRAA